MVQEQEATIVDLEKKLEHQQKLLHYAQLDSVADSTISAARSRQAGGGKLVGESPASRPVVQKVRDVVLSVAGAIRLNRIAQDAKESAGGAGGSYQQVAPDSEVID